MDQRSALRVGALAWAVIGAGVALGSLGEVNADARLIVATASIIGPLAAVVASHLIARGADRAAGVLLLVSVLTPTYFAYVLNLPALVVGLTLLVAPHLLLAPLARPRSGG